MVHFLIVVCSFVSLSLVRPLVNFPFPVLYSSLYYFSPRAACCSLLLVLHLSPFLVLILFLFQFVYVSPPTQSEVHLVSPGLIPHILLLLFIIVLLPLFCCANILCKNATAIYPLISHLKTAINETDPADQLSWLRSTLQAARDEKEKVLIIAQFVYLPLIFLIL